LILLLRLPSIALPARVPGCIPAAGDGNLSWNFTIMKNSIGDSVIIFWGGTGINTISKKDQPQSAHRIWNFFLAFFAAFAFQ